MGATAEQGEDAIILESPTHQVTLSDYYIAETEVTQELWVAVIGSNPSMITSSLQNPVECVSWDDCKIFIQKLNELTGHRFRLPSEAEWEYAARGGKKCKGYKFAGSNLIDDVAWYDDNSGDVIHEVAKNYPNELGLYDMSGNVWEWCYDWYGSYSSAVQRDPYGPSSGYFRVIRGGSWYDYATFCRVSSRSACSPGGSFNYYGLRLAASRLE